MKTHQHAQLIYDRESYAFITEGCDEDHASISINDLQLAIDETRRIMYVWGLCPLINYELTTEFPQHYSSHTLIAELGKEPEPGVAYGLNKDRWPIYINKEKGWVCIGNPQVQGKKLIKFAPDCIATIENDEIIALWLHPEKLPDHIFQ